MLVAQKPKLKQHKKTSLYLLTREKLDMVVHSQSHQQINPPYSLQLLNFSKSSTVFLFSKQHATQSKI